MHWHSNQIYKTGYSFRPDCGFDSNVGVLHPEWFDTAVTREEADEIIEGVV